MQKSRKSFSQCFRSCFGLFSSWFRPYENNNFIQSQIPQLAELTMYYLNLVTTSRVRRNPTVKAEIEQKNLGKVFRQDSLFIPFHKLLILLPLQANLVPVGEDQNQCWNKRKKLCIVLIRRTVKF